MSRHTAATTGSVRVTMGDPVIVAVSAPGESRWGYHQFPKLSWLNGRGPGAPWRLLLTFNACPDDDLHYGKTSPAFVSDDLGQTWQPFAPAAGTPEAMLTVSHSPISTLANGDMLCTPFPIGRKASELPADLLDKPVARFLSYAERRLYWLKDCPAFVREYYRAVDAARYTARTQRWEKTQIRWDIDDMLVRVFHGQSWVRTSFEQKLCELDGELFCADYKSYYRHADGSPPKSMDTWCMVSTDGGRSFHRRSLMAAHPTGQDIMGEGAIAVDANHELVSVIRRTDHQHKPMVITRSSDRGHTWSAYQPVFEHTQPFGVLPQLVLLNNGILVLSFGRPGVWLACATDGTGRSWSDPTPVIASTIAEESTHAASCGYTSALALDDDTFLLAYSDFRHRDGQGRACKAIVVRAIKARV